MRFSVLSTDVHKLIVYIILSMRSYKKLSCHDYYRVTLYIDWRLGLFTSSCLLCLDARHILFTIFNIQVVFRFFAIQSFPDSMIVMTPKKPQKQHKDTKLCLSWMNGFLQRCCFDRVSPVNFRWHSAKGLQKTPSTQFFYILRAIFFERQRSVTFSFWPDPFIFFCTFVNVLSDRKHVWRPWFWSF